MADLPPTRLHTLPKSIKLMVNVPLRSLYDLLLGGMGIALPKVVPILKAQSNGNIRDVIR